MRTGSVVAAVVLLAACSGTPGTTPSETGSAIDSPRPTASSSTGAPATPSSTPSSAPATPPPSPAVLIEIAPDGPLVGVALGTGTDEAVAALSAALGPPAEDTGWFEGCPLDGAGDNERFLFWGGLRADFAILDDPVGEFVSWGFSVEFADDSGPSPDEVVLPDGMTLRDTLADIAAATGFPTSYSDTFDITVLGEGFTVYASGDDPTATPDGASVPFLPACE